LDRKTPVATPGFFFRDHDFALRGRQVSEEIFARKVYQRRKEMKLSLREIARITGIAASTISRLENGRLSPTLDIATKLATALNLELPVTPAFTPARAEAVAGDDNKTLDMPAQLVAYRKLGHTILRGGRRRDLSRIAASNGYQVAILVRGVFQLRTNDGFRENLKIGATLNCKLLANHTYFGIASEEAELLWVG
jgi:transcriptional regulator with XRE-family HTH domain